MGDVVKFERRKKNTAYHRMDECEWRVMAFDFMAERDQKIVEFAEALVVAHVNMLKRKYGLLPK